MRKSWLVAAACVAVAGATSGMFAQESAKSSACECGKHPPGPPTDRVVEPYAGEPADLSPYGKFAAPYDLNYVHPNIYTGAERDIAEPKNLT
jgi:branched-chain amino acid transport system substrate-binding protein